MNNSCRKIEDHARLAQKTLQQAVEGSADEINELGDAMIAGKERAYCLVTPARNEEAHIERTLACVTSQTLPPTKWLIVDDGSTDSTAQVASDWAERFDYIQLVRRADRGHDAVGGGVVEAFNVGLSRLPDFNLPYLGKVDADIEIEADYFERLIERFEQSTNAGIMSGQNYLRVGDKLLPERHQRFHPVGGARLYRYECFQRIHGLVPVPGWDTLDVIRARMHGYHTEVFDDLKVIHRRPMGSRNELRGGVQRLGRISHLLGYHPIYFALRVLGYAFRRPFLFRAWWLLKGYFISAGRREPYITTVEERRWLRQFQVMRLLGKTD
jgi:glycosyltransferase involved in cell wall biosynthesis